MHAHDKTCLTRLGFMGLLRRLGFSRQTVAPARETLREPGPVCFGRGGGHMYDRDWRCIFCRHRPPAEERINWGRNLDGSPTVAPRRAQERRDRFGGRG